MIDDVRDIAAYYDGSLESEHNRLDRHQLEHDLTWIYFNRYLPPQGTILEVGAATGRYTLELAKRCYTITAVDLSAGLLSECRKRIAAAGLERQVRYVQADARDLSQVIDKDFDAVLLMGPLYHLVEEDDRKTALKEAFDRLKEGGIIFTSFISRFGILGDLIKKDPGFVDDQVEVRCFIEKGKDSDDYPPGRFRGYFARVDEIAPLHEAVGFETLAVAGVEPAISADDESYNRLEGKQRQLWLDLLYEISTEESIIGSSRHLLYVGRKR
jgi:ubiquinone/menaquinone biosynthesis C-methylase UbiE